MSVFADPITTRVVATHSARMLGLGMAFPPDLAQSSIADVICRMCCETDQQRAWADMILGRCGVQRRGSVLFARDTGEAAPAEDVLCRLVDRFYPPRAHADDRGPTTAQRMQQYAKYAPVLAAEAAAAALNDAGVQAEDITHLLPVSCTGFFAPGLDAALITRLGLSPSVQRLQIGFMGCHGAFNALAAARAIAMADPAARILVCCVELCSLHLAYGWDPQRVVANALFSDGAAAAIIGAIVRCDHTAGHDGWTLGGSASLHLPDSTDAMTWVIGDHGFTMTLSPKLPDLIRGGIRPWITSWLDQHGLAIADIRSWAIHPGGPKVLTAVTDALALAPQEVQVSRDVLARHGNMSSATILCILDELRRRSAPGPCVAIGFGPGLMAEAMLLL